MDTQATAEALMDRWREHGAQVKVLREDFDNFLVEAQHEQSAMDRENNAHLQMARAAAKIANLLDGQPWVPNQLVYQIADVLVQAGFRVRDTDDATVYTEAQAVAALTGAVD